MSPNPEINYKLSEEDLLEFQMFTSAHSKSHRRQRLRSSLLVVLGWVALGFYLLKDSPAVAYALFTLALAWVLFGRSLLKWRYAQHFRKHIQEHRSGIIGIDATLRIEESSLYSQTADGDGKVAYSGIESLVEVAGAFLIKLKQSLTLIIPKRDIDPEELRAFMESVSRNTGLPIENRTTYKWR